MHRMQILKVHFDFAWRRQLIAILTVIILSLPSCTDLRDLPVFSSEASAKYESHWHDLAGFDPAKTYNAMTELATPSAIPFLAEHLRPIPIDLQNVRRLISTLDSEDYFIRERSSRELEAMGEILEPEILASLRVISSPETKSRLCNLMHSIERLRECPPSPGIQFQRLLAIQILEIIGTPESCKVLESTFTSSPSLREQVEAKRSIEAIRLRASFGYSQLPITLTNTIGMKLQLIPRGIFLMGSPKGEVGRDKEESLHLVRISNIFYVGATEVTQSEWKAIMGKDSNASRFQAENLPVESVSWDDAVEFCKRLSKKEGRKYSLLTESEWEYACRAGTTTPFNIGVDIDRKSANIEVWL